MSYVMKYLPEIDELRKELSNPNIVEIYRKYGSYAGSIESINYLHEKLNVVLEQENSYIEERFMG